MRRGGAAAAAIAATLTLAAPASALRFGTNLNRFPDLAVDCNHVFVSYESYGSCTVESQNLVTGESFIPPLGVGVITHVGVRVGNFTGPMQVVVEEALRPAKVDPSGRNYYCCAAKAFSQVFTPRPNTTTVISVRFRVKQSRAPERSGYYVDDHLALSVLSPNVPIPASSDPNGVFSYWAPAWSFVGQEEVGPGGSSQGADILMDAEWHRLRKHHR